MNKKLLFRLAALLAAMMCALGANAAEAYACVSYDTLTFYYDDQRNSHSTATFDVNAGDYFPGWLQMAGVVKYVVFDPSFAAARPTSTRFWFAGMDLESITGLSYLNTSEVINMAYMFSSCFNLTSLDLSSFNTSKVTNMEGMFDNCANLINLDLSSFNTSQVTNMESMFEDCTSLHTVCVGSGWTTASVIYSDAMFKHCASLVGGKGTTYDANHVDDEYAHIDGGPSNPGYFTEKPAILRGDVNGDLEVSVADVNVAIDIILGGNVSTPAADVNGDGEINIADVNAVIDIILDGTQN